MNNVKIIYFNTDTISNKDIENALLKSEHHLSHVQIKPGLVLLNYQGTAKDLYEEFGCVVQDQNIFIHDLNDGHDAYWGYMNKNIWDWLKENRT